MVMGFFCFAKVIPLVYLVYLLKLIDGKHITSEIGGSCDIFNGNWVYDNNYPSYNVSQCPFIEQVFDCQKNGRPDKTYQSYRWRPNGCSLPRFDGKKFLSKYQNKNIVFIGDSLSLNQWQSLTCMLHVAVPESNYTSQRTGLMSTFKFLKYGVSIIYSRDAVLVDIVKVGNERVLKLDSISYNRRWEKMDVLIFDTWHWWLHTGTKQVWDVIQYGNTTVKDMDRLTAYEMALNTWAKWVNTNVAKNTKVFFQGISPDHSVCAGEKQPLKTNSDGPREEELVLEKVMSKMSRPVQLLNINGLSKLRSDGHPSKYGQPRGMDCTHWCLPGVPDTWNHLLYSLLQN